MRLVIAIVAILGTSVGCGDATMVVVDSGTTDSSSSDTSVDPPDSGAGDTGPVDAGDSGLADADPGDSGLADAGDADPGDAGLDASDASDVGPDATSVTHYGVVSVADADMAAFVGQIQGAFVASSELALIDGARAPIAGAPDCYEAVPPPPVVPTYLDAGTLVFDGLLLSGHMLSPSSDGDYSFEYAGLFLTPDDPVTVTVPGGSVIEAMTATAATPDPATSGSWTSGSTGIGTTWTAGNGDFVLLRFTTSAGSIVCEVPDTGSYLIPAAALSPDTTPSGDAITYQRVIETITRSASGTQELRFRTFTQSVLVSP